MPQSYAQMPPPPAMFPGGQQAPPPSAPYSYPLSSGQNNPPSASGSYSTAGIYALLERQKQATQSAPTSGLPPDSARYQYPPSSAQQSTSPPPASGSAGQNPTIQGIMALLVNSIFIHDFVRSLTIFFCRSRRHRIDHALFFCKRPLSKDDKRGLCMRCLTITRIQ